MAPSIPDSVSGPVNSPPTRRTIDVLTTLAGFAVPEESKRRMIQGLTAYAGLTRVAAMKPGALLINTARGGLVDEQALADALRAGHIGGAGFDVLSEEPPRANPLLAADLLEAGNFILTPHVAWSSGEAMQALADQLIGNIEAFAAGSPRNRVV